MADKYKSVYHDICDAMAMVPRIDVANLNQVWATLGSYWPLPSGESCLIDLKLSVKDSIQDLIETSGRAVLEFSHDRSVLQRELGHLEDSWKERYRDHFTRLALEFFASFFLPAAEQFRELPLNILVVDNKPEEILQYNQFLPPQLGFAFWKKANWYVWDSNFSKFESQLREITAGNTQQLSLRTWNPISGKKEEETKKVDAQDLDLILQDQFLAEPERPDITGSRLAEYYADVAPQALVFLCTGTDVDELAALGEMQFTDRVVAKNKLAALPWYYYLAFIETLGSMFWEGWLTSKKGTGFGGRTSLRRLLGTIRTWRREPDILWHAQSLPEMVDHSHPHITDLWRLTDEVLGARNGDGSPVYSEEDLPLKERILLALGIWLHDVGHRGDEHRTDPVTIREVHGAISESLLFRNPGAFGVKWLLDYCTKKDTPESCPGTCSVNDLTDERGLCPLRMTGLICRHHQSSAPLSKQKIPSLITGIKTLSDYSRVGYDMEGKLAVDPVAQWCEENVDLEWLASDIRSLDDFQPKAQEGDVDLLRVACLVRFFDAVHLHRYRAGSPTKRLTHQDYLDNRRKHCDHELDRLNRVLETTPPGSKAYIAAYHEGTRLSQYRRQVLNTQGPHLWRQQLVERREVCLSEEGGIRVVFHLREVKSAEGDTWNNEEIWKEECEEWLKGLGDAVGKDRNSLHARLKTALDGGQVPFVAWTLNFLCDVLGSEIKGQVGLIHKSETSYLLSNVFKNKTLSFWVKYPGGEFELGDLRACLKIAQGT